MKEKVFDWFYHNLDPMEYLIPSVKKEVYTQCKKDLNIDYLTIHMFNDFFDEWSK